MMRHRAANGPRRRRPSRKPDVGEGEVCPGRLADQLADPAGTIVSSETF